MAEGLFQKLEEKIMMLLTDLEESQKKIQYVTNENAVLRIELERRMQDQQAHETKLKDLLSLVDSVSALDSVFSATSNVAAMKPMLVQNEKM